MSLPVGQVGGKLAVMLRNPPASSPPVGDCGCQAAALSCSTIVPEGGLRVGNDQHNLENRKPIFQSRFVNPYVADPKVVGTEQPTRQ